MGKKWKGVFGTASQTREEDNEFRVGYILFHRRPLLASQRLRESNNKAFHTTKFKSIACILGLRVWGNAPARPASVQT